MKSMKLLSTVLGAANAFQVGVNDSTKNFYLWGNGAHDES